MDLQVHTSPFLLGNYAPIESEDDFRLTVRGDLPAELSGVLYRNGPNPQFAPRDENYHWFIGDGMVHAFAIEGGRVSYRNRFVRTQKWELEHAAGHALFGSWANPATTDSSVIAVDSGVANTNVVSHAGRLLALEEAHAPVRLDAGSLETLGDLDLGGRVTAHPKIDPATGEMIFFAYSDGPRPLTGSIGWGIADSNGRLVRRETFEAPYCSMIHDFMVTEHYVLVPVLPLTGDGARAMKGGPLFAWEPEKPAMVAVMHRTLGVASLRWFTTDAAYFFHVMNAYEVDGTIVGDVMKYSSPPLFPDASGRPGAATAAHLERWTFDLSGSTGTIRTEALDDRAGEFPRFDDRFAGRPYRHGWMTTHKRGLGSDATFGGITHLDVKNGNRESFVLPDGDATSEAVFVPRDAAAAEGDGWLLAVVYRGREDRSDLLVFDAQNVAAGQIASAALPRRMPFGFHGSWVGGEGLRA